MKDIPESTSPRSLVAGGVLVLGRLVAKFKMSVAR